MLLNRLLLFILIFHKIKAQCPSISDQGYYRILRFFENAVKPRFCRESRINVLYCDALNQQQICNAGFYCEGDGQQRQCAVSTQFQPFKGKYQSSDCITCPLANQAPLFFECTSVGSDPTQCADGEYSEFKNSG